MADNATSNFPKMGESALEDFVNTSGNRSPYTMPVGRKGPSGDSENEPASVRPVGSVATGEHNGPRFAPVTTIDFPNAPEHVQTGRALKRVPSSVGNRDFWDSRSSQSGVVIA